MKNRIKRELPTRLKSWKTKFDRWSVPAKVSFFVLGIASTIWFLIRVIPKPSRATYPCMQAAAPVMSAFIVYVLSFSGAFLSFRKAKVNFYKARYAIAAVFGLLSIVISFIFFSQDMKVAYARVTTPLGVLPDAPNSPMGEGAGLNPGRVAWVFNPDATNVSCTNSWGPDGKGDTADDDGYFLPKNTNKEIVKVMLDSAMLNLTGETTVFAAWDKVFKYFNNKKGLGEVGYSPEQTIFIKINQGSASWLADQNTMNPTAASWAKNNYANSETTPQTILAVIHHLVTDYGVPQEMIYVGDPIAHVYQYTIDIIKKEYPNIVFFDHNLSKMGRTVSKGLTASDVIYYSDNGKSMPDAVGDRIYQEMYDADYMINMAALKAHARAGVTLCAKNHFGSHGRDAASHLHPGLIAPENDIQERTDYKMYRVLTDIIGHDKLGGNTLLFFIDGLWGGPEAVDKPVKWKMPPFNNDWPSSILISQDQVALESVCLDFLRQEASVNPLFKNRPFFGAVDDYLHQAADKANWPKDIVYDPEGDGTPMKSMGVHEHWNNSTDKQYTRNLGTGSGIDLISTPYSLVKRANTSTGIQDQKSKAEITVYPNPASDRITVKAILSGETDITLAIYDLNGREIITRKLVATDGRIDETINFPNSMQKGNYLVRLAGEKIKRYLNSWFIKIYKFNGGYTYIYTLMHYHQYLNDLIGVFFLCSLLHQFVAFCDFIP